MNQDKIDISVVIPAFNEAERIPQTLKIIEKFFGKHKYTYEIIVVSDGSSDNTVEVCNALNFPNLKTLSYKVNRGKGYAVNYGVTRAKGEVVIFVDADNSTPFEQIEKLLPNINDYPVVIGSRYCNGGKIIKKQPFSRRLGARLGNLLIRAILLPRLKDTQCGFKLFTQEAAKEIFSRQTIWRWGFDIEVLYIAKKLQFKTKEVGVRWVNDEGTKIQSPFVFLSTLSELFKIKLNALQGEYRR